MRTTFLLLKDIQNELKRAFVDYLYENKDGVTTPNIWIGHVPPKRSMPAGSDNKMAVGDPPFILVRGLEGAIKYNSTKARIHEVQINIVCCVYCRDSHDDTQHGYNEIMNMVDRSVFVLNEHRYWANKRFTNSDDINWVFGLEKNMSSAYEAGMQDLPYFGAVVSCIFQSAAAPRPKSPLVDAN